MRLIEGRANDVSIGQYTGRAKDQWRGGGGDIGVMGGLGGRLLVERWYSNATTKELKGRFATADPEVGKTADR